MEILSQKLSSTDILNIFIEQHRICSPLDIEADPTAVLNFESTINEWREANDLLPWRELSKYLNEAFGIFVSEEEWKATLNPSRSKTLKDVCELISKNCDYQDIKPVNIFGKNCLSASIFITLKKYLSRRNVDVSEIKPSTEIEPYLNKYYSEMLEQIGIISNGKKIFDDFDYKTNNKIGFWNIFKFPTNKYQLETGEIKTFRDLIEKIIEKNQKHCG